MALKKPYKSLTGAAKWRDIEDLINRWANRNKRGALEQERWLRETKEELHDKKNAKWAKDLYGKGGRVGAETKFSVLMHPELMAYIKMFYPDFLETKEDLHEFMVKFPKFRIRRVI